MFAEFEQRSPHKLRTLSLVQLMNEHDTCDKLITEVWLT